MERPLLTPDELYQSPDALRERLNKLARIEVWASDHPRIDDAAALGDQPLPPLPVAAKTPRPARRWPRSWAITPAACWWPPIPPAGAKP